MKLGACAQNRQDNLGGTAIGEATHGGIGGQVRSS
jgi:hypothetical protein